MNPVVAPFGPNAKIVNIAALARCSLGPETGCGWHVHCTDKKEKLQAKGKPSSGYPIQ